MTNAEHQRRHRKKLALEKRRETISAKRRRRDSREAALGAALAAGNLALPNKRYAVILADPEWRFEPYSRETGMDRAADNHYLTSATEVIAARPVADIAANNCVLFLWATVPMLPDALAVMAAWGFSYRSSSSSFFRHEISPRTVPRPGHLINARDRRVVPVGGSDQLPASPIPLLAALPVHSDAGGIPDPLIQIGHGPDR